MPKKHITALTGGLNEVSRPDLLNDNEVQECVNYEINGIGILQKRTEPTVYDETLNNLLKNLYDTESGQVGKVSFMSPPYYPPTKPSDMVGDFMLLFYGSPTPGNQNYAYYLTYLSNRGDSDAWVYTDELTNDLLEPLKDGKLGLVFNQNNSPQVSIGENGILLTDNINPPILIFVDSFGEVKAQKFTLNAPKNKPIIDVPKPAETDDDNPEMIYTDFLSTDSNMPYVCEPGLIQMVYTVITKDGEESNPSPISETGDFQYLNIEDSGDMSHFIKKIVIRDLAIPVVSDDMKTKLEKFNVYMRVLKYTASVVPKDFQYVESFKIIDKDATDGETKNVYTITNKLQDGEFVSYENDGAPISQFNEQVAGVSFLGSIIDKALLPYNFDNIIPITVENKDNKNFVDFNLDLRLYDKNSSEVTLSHKRIDSLDWADYLVGDDAQIDGVTTAQRQIEASKLHQIRIFHTDRTTPCMALYMTYGANKSYIDVRVVIPYLTKGINTLYFAFGGDGILDVSRRTLEYGMFIQTAGFGGTSFDPQKMPQSKYFFKYAPLLDEDVLLAQESTKKGPKLSLPDYTSRNGNGWSSLAGTPVWPEGSTTQSIINKANMRYSAPIRPSSIYDQTEAVQGDWQSEISIPKENNNFQGDRLAGSVSSPYININRGDLIQWGTYPYGDLGIGGGLANQKFSVWGTITYQEDAFKTLRYSYDDSYSPTGHRVLYGFSLGDDSFPEYVGAKPPLALSGMSLAVHCGLGEGDWVATRDTPPNINPYTYTQAYWGYNKTEVNGLALILYNNSSSAWQNAGQTHRVWLQAGQYSGEQTIELRAVPRPTLRPIATHFSADFPLMFGKGNSNVIYKYMVGMSVDDKTGDVSLFMSDLNGAFCNSAENVHNAQQGRIYHVIKRGAYQAPHLDGYGGFAQFTTGNTGYGRLTDYENNNMPTTPPYSTGTNFGGDFVLANRGANAYHQTWNLRTQGVNYINTTVKVDEFFTTDDESSLDRLYSIQAGSYPTNNPIGKKYLPFPAETESSVNNMNVNISFEEPIVTGKTFKNMVKWSNLYSFGFPDLNYLLVGEPIKAMIKAPSFLKFEYDNTLIIFTRNNIYRFVLSGTPDSWKGRVDNLIEEYTEYGLYAPKTLVRAGEALFWMSERGVIKWDVNGLKVISDERINVELNEESVGYYNPVNNQYIINYK